MWLPLEPGSSVTEAGSVLGKVPVSSVVMSMSQLSNAPRKIGKVCAPTGAAMRVLKLPPVCRGALPTAASM
jgi:hypothetical protein